MTKTQDSLRPRVLRLIGKARLEAWRDRLAAYWSRTVDHIDEEQLLLALTNLFGKKEGRRLLRTTRSEQVQALTKGDEDRLVSRLVDKVRQIVKGPGDRLEAADLILEEHDYSEADVTHEGRTYHHDVEGIMCITGVITARHPDSTTTTITLFAKWISHPFWQYGSAVVRPTVGPGG